MPGSWPGVGSCEIAALAWAQSRLPICWAPTRRRQRQVGARAIPCCRSHAAKANRVIFLFMAGAPSHLDLFDNKPQLAKFDGHLPPADLIQDYRAAFINPNSKLLGPKFKFARHGHGGAELSELLPHLAEIVDDIAIVQLAGYRCVQPRTRLRFLMNTGTSSSAAPASARGRSTAWELSPKTCPASSC